MKKKIHPKWYKNAKVFCDGRQIFCVGSTKPVLKTDVWSGNHPFYTGSQKTLDNEKCVERLIKKFSINFEV